MTQPSAATSSSPEDKDDRPTEEQMRDALLRVGLGPFLAGLPEGLDTPVGPGGTALSGGQRQRLAVARALLARAEWCSSTSPPPTWTPRPPAP